jgi:hypothetical protein
MSKAEIYDRKFVESLLGHTNSLVFLVRGDVTAYFTFTSRSLTITL